jgi:Abortive infection alpha
MAAKRGSDQVQKSLAAKAFGPAIEEFGKEIRPLGKDVGALGVRAARALLKPVGGLVWGFEKVEEWIAEAVAPKIDRIPEEFRIEPKLVVAGPALDSMKYCGSEPHLRDLFANLLATAMDSRRASNAHPAFVEMVKQLSSNEAKILKRLAHGFQTSIAVIEVHRTWMGLDDHGVRKRMAVKVFGPYSLIGFYAGCGRLKTLPSLISNLSRLEIVEVDIPREIDKRSLEELLDDELISDIRSELTTFSGRETKGNNEFDWGFGYATGYMTLTALGEQFLDTCVRDRNR